MRGSSLRASDLAAESASNLKDAGHDRSIREMARELRLVRCDALDANGALSRHIFQDLVDEKERVAVGKDLANISVDEDLKANRMRDSIYLQHNIRSLQVRKFMAVV